MPTFNTTIPYVISTLHSLTTLTDNIIAQLIVRFDLILREKMDLLRFNLPHRMKSFVRLGTSPKVGNPVVNSSSANPRANLHRRRSNRSRSESGPLALAVRHRGAGLSRINTCIALYRRDGEV